MSGDITDWGLEDCTHRKMSRYIAFIKEISKKTLKSYYVLGTVFSGYKVVVQKIFFKNVLKLNHFEMSSPCEIIFANKNVFLLEMSS